MLRSALALLIALGALTSPAFARDSLGVFSSWGAFRDPGVPRCYAIAMAPPNGKRRDYQPYAAVGIWPRQGVRNQLHLRLSRRIAPGGRITLSLGGNRYELTGGGGDAWTVDPRMDAAVIAGMRSNPAMWVSARDATGQPFTDRYELAGAATAMDAAAVGCARLR